MQQKRDVYTLRNLAAQRRIEKDVLILLWTYHLTKGFSAWG